MWYGSRKVSLIAGVAMHAQLAACSGPEPHLFSSRASPSGLMVAENFLIGGNEMAFGRLVLRNINTGERVQWDFKRDTADVFLTWIDEDHLELDYERADGDPAPPSSLGDVHVLSKPYNWPDHGAYIRKDIPIDTYDVAERDLKVDVWETQDSRRTCHLFIGLKNAKIGEASAMMSARAIGQCKGYGCFDADLHFHLKTKDRSSRQYALTSATISGAKLATSLPEGTDGTDLRGQFLGGNLDEVIAAIEKPSFDLTFSLNHFTRLVRFHIPFSSFLNAPRSLSQCLTQS